MTDTPETDAMEYFDAMCDPDRVVEADFARKLERERNEARERADTMFAKHVDILEQTRNDGCRAKILAELEIVEHK